MSDILTSILERQTVFTPEGKEETLHSSIDGKEVAFLESLIEKFKVERSLEVGCAMGISSLAICGAITKNSPNSHHTIIDPNQRTEWKNIGVHHLQKAGFQNFHLIEEPSEFALPELAKKNCQFDFAFIDGWHTFDQTLIDFYYINRMLRTGGIVVVDDVRMPSVKKVMRMIHTYPCYRFVDRLPVPFSRRTKAVEAIKICMQPVNRLFGKRLSAELFDASVRRSDKSLGLNSSIVAFQKFAEDNRPWNWYENF
jgi:predicted O-methyltransferase YrrM